MTRIVRPKNEATIGKPLRRLREVVIKPPEIGSRE